MGEVRFMISEAAKQVDVESHVLRYWEEELGLTIGRTEMGHRYYTNDDIQLFRCIKKLKDEGMLLRELKPLIPELKETRKKMKAGGAPVVKASALSRMASAAADSAASAGSSGGQASDNSKSPAAVSIPAAVSAPSTLAASESGDVMIPLKNVEQMRALVGDVFRDALCENNDV